MKQNNGKTQNKRFVGCYGKFMGAMEGFWVEETMKSLRAQRKFCGMLQKVCESYGRFLGLQDTMESFWGMEGLLDAIESLWKLWQN